jgi:1-deoxyxylulose-5-phosphate synthase
MEYAKLGNTGLTVSRICLGCMSYGEGDWREWTLDTAAAREHFALAIESGVTFFDTADVYSNGSSEEITGHWLGEMAARDDIVIATKVQGPMSYGIEASGATNHNRQGLGRKHIIEACENSLRRLNTDYIDLYQIHRWDFRTPIEETLDALDSLVSSGKVRYLGASSMAAWQFSNALHTAKEFGWQRFVSMQNHYNLIYREEEREMIPLCIDQGIGLIPWSPLARGFLDGNRSAEKGEGPTKRAQTDHMARTMYFKENDYEIAEATQQIARNHGITPTQAACAWILQAPGVTAPIIGATKSHHLQEIFATVEIKLSEEDVAAMEAPYRPHAIAGHSQPTPARMIK